MQPVAAVEGLGDEAVTARSERAVGSASYQFFMLVLCVYALVALAAQTVSQLAPETRDVLEYADLVVCGLFLLDFVHSLIRAKDRWLYLRTWGWIDLLSSIPSINATRWGRAARIIRVLRVLRGLRATKVMAGLVLRRRGESAILGAGLMALLLIVFGSVAILALESTPESNIKTAEDAIWWAFSSIMTVGYGDYYPVTSEGRIVAAILMCSGIGLSGTLAGFLAASFIGPARDEQTETALEIRALRDDLKELRRLVEMRGPGRS
jgi:voltage-gated potassium channel